MSSSPLARRLHIANVNTIITPTSSTACPLSRISPFLAASTKLYRAIESQDDNIVRQMLGQHQNLDPNRLIPGHSMTLLHLAVGLSDNKTEIVERLLKRGGNANNTNIEEKVSPMHLSVIYDYHNVLQVLVRYGGDPKVVTGDKKNCYDIAKDNLESEMLENCFLYFYTRSLAFRKSIKPSDSIMMSLRENKSANISEHFYSCESKSQSDLELTSENRCLSRDGVNRRLNFNDNDDYSYLMTEDESTEIEECSSIGDGRLSTIEEESGQSRPSAVTTPYLDHRNHFDPSPSISGSSGSITEPSCANSTPPLLSEPTAKELEKLQKAMKNLQIPVTLSTFGVLNKYAHQESKLKQVLTPKSGTQNFSSELQLCLQNLNLVLEWGNLKIDLLQNCTPTGKSSKSFYNYLLLDPKIIKKANFSGNHLKSDVIKNVEKFETFLRSIFYIGKGCGKRPIQHLVDAKAKLRSSRRSNSQCGEKIDKILDIWKSGLGVNIVSVFHHSSEREANVNEAAMIDAVGLVELSNIKKGSYGGTIATSWSQKTKNQLGSFLLHKCFCSFAVSDHKSFFPMDI